MKKARKAQQEKRGKDAEKHLQEAVKALGRESSQKKKEDQKQGKSDQEKGSPKKDENSRNQPSPQKNSQAAPPRPKEGKLNKEQAKKLLELMANDEKTLKDELKERQKRLMRTRTVEKDW